MKLCNYSFLMGTKALYLHGLDFMYSLDHDLIYACAREFMHVCIGYIRQLFTIQLSRSIVAHHHIFL